eukprot:NODE_12511_length_230_cov_19.895028_g10741_i0.p2 GENE.NODE_12511_length_230_cov_19.895028_g10741_i0~~NODE_12511_length_230_cov_19.895028_g10741_i0.p2  ORF type:complete len:65 (-),score=17.32 NODE_12511_length_230_cov_19.895028_g10741_i0:34-201(-)
MGCQPARLSVWPGQRDLPLLSPPPHPSSSRHRFPYRDGAFGPRPAHALSFSFFFS